MMAILGSMPCRGGQIKTFGILTGIHHTLVKISKRALLVLKMTDLATKPSPKLDWVIAGGESGPNARPMHPDWARSLRDQCKAADVPFFFKQWGEWAPYDRGRIDSSNLATPGPTDNPMQKFGKSRAGRLLDGVEHSEFPKCAEESANA